MFGVSSSSRLLWMVQLDRVCVRGVWVLRFVRHSAKRCKGAGSVCILIDKAGQVGSEYSLAAWGGGVWLFVGGSWWLGFLGVLVGGVGGLPRGGLRGGVCYWAPRCSVLLRENDRDRLWGGGAAGYWGSVVYLFSYYYYLFIFFSST